ncbi:MAG TPA: ABC transporter substrate-binding protein [Mycobacteriales bacterium]|nr:ABC transporter substrate-binding protein [Mycobacteriales bacterium]
MRGRRLLACAGIGAAVVALAACGTRLPDRAFGPRTVTQSTAATAAAAVVPEAQGAAVTAAPTQAAVTSGQETQANGSTVTTGSGSTGSTGSEGSTRSTGASTATGAPTAGPTAGPSASGKPGRAKAPYASDIGVTATTITVGNVTTKGGTFGPYTFTPQYYGVRAYFADLNAHGGIDGRRVDLQALTDDGDDGSNSTAIHSLIDQSKVFAFVGNNIFSYGAADYVHKMGVPDIGGEPIGSGYDKYDNFFEEAGTSSPRDNVHSGYPDGTNFQGWQYGVYFKQAINMQFLGVVAYDQGDSLKGADELTQSFAPAGIKTKVYTVNLGLPNFAATVAEMKNDGVDSIADALDINGNQKLCQAIESDSAFVSDLKVKISNPNVETAQFGKLFSSTPKCAGKTWIIDSADNFMDPQYPEIAHFQQAFAQYSGGPSSPYYTQWALHGWIAAEMFTDAVRSCGADLTRACVEKWMMSWTVPHPYTANGDILDNASWVEVPESVKSDPKYTSRDCIAANEWDPTQNKWVTRADLQHNCYVTGNNKFSEHG